MVAIFQQNATEVASETFDDGLVSINFLTGRYFTMNRSGEVVWACLAQASTSAAIAEHLARLSVVDRDVVLKDVEAFLETLNAERMIMVGQVAECPISAEAMAAAADPFAYEAPRLNVFEDLTDLILLDPIHDVNEALGWPVSRVDPAR